MLTSSYIRSLPYHGNHCVGIWDKVIKSSLSSEAALYVLSHQHVTTEHVKTEISCLCGCQQVSAKVFAIWCCHSSYNIHVGHELWKCNCENCGSVLIGISPLVSYTATNFFVYVHVCQWVGLVQACTCDVDQALFLPLPHS